MNPIELMNTCLANKELNRKICENDNFWKLKYKKDFENYEEPDKN